MSCPFIECKRGHQQRPYGACDTPSLCFSKDFSKINYIRDSQPNYGFDLYAYA